MRYLLLILLLPALAGAAPKKNTFAAGGAAVSSAGPTLGQIPIAPDILCGVGVNTGADAWECRGPDGPVTVNNPVTGKVFEKTAFGRKAMRLPDVGHRPSAVIPTDIYAGSVTIVAVGYPSGGASSAAIVFHGNANTDGIYMTRGSSGTTFCRRHSSLNAGSTQSGPDPANGWSVSSCVFGSTTFKARTNGTSVSASTGTIDPPTSNMYFMASSTGGSANTGLLAAVAIYKRELTDDELARIEAGWFGAMVGGRPITTTRSTPAVCQADDGSVYTVGENAPCVHSKGFFVGRRAENYVPNSTDLSTWPDLGGGTKALQNDGSWLLTDNNAADFARWTAAGARDQTAGQAYTATCEMKAGTTNKASLRNGLDAGVCNVTLTDAWARYSCSGTAATTSTASAYVQPRVGHVAADTGTIFTRQCQLEQTATPGRRVDCTTAPCTVEAEKATMTTDGWPVSEWEVSLDFTPFAPSTGANRALLNTDNGQSGAARGGYVLYLNSTNGAARTLGYAAGVSTITSSSNALTWVPDKKVRLTHVVAGGFASVYRDGALLNRDVFPTITGPLRNLAYIGGEASANWSEGWTWPLYIGPPRGRTGEGQSYFEADLWHSGEPKACTTEDSCVLDCWANAAGSMDCRDGTGGAVAVTPGVGATVEPTPFRPADGRVVRGATSSGTFGNLTLPVALNGPWSMVTVGQSGPAGGAASVAAAMSPGTAQGLVTSAGTWGCNYNGSAAITGASTRGTWAVGSCVWDGSKIAARANGTAATMAATQAASATSLVFSNAGNPLNGPLAHVRIYSRALSDAELDEYESRMWGTWAAKPGTPIKVSRSTPTSCVVQGSRYILGPNAPCVNEKGLAVFGATSYTDSADCAGGAAPCTRAADVATVATTGWPVERGFAEVNYTPTEPTSIASRYLFASETAGNGIAVYVANASANNTIVARNVVGGNAIGASRSQVGVLGQPFTSRVLWTPTSLSSCTDHSSCGTIAGQTLLTHPSPAGIGNTPSGTLQADGWLRNLRLGAY